MFYSKIPIFLLAVAMSTSTLVVADDHDDEEAFEEGRLFFELNDTDGDLGIHGKIDGDEWKRLEIEDPNGRRMLNVSVNGRLKRQGLTELFFESAEPTFDELRSKTFFNRFPEGVYEIEGITLDGDELENEVYLSHVIPAAPADVTVGGVGEAAGDAAENCDADLLEVDPTGGVTIRWAEVDRSHATLGRDPDTSLDELFHTPDGVQVDIEVLSYEVVVEVDETPFVTTAIVPGNVTEWTFSGDFFELAEVGETDEGFECEESTIGADCFAEYKYEILVRINNGQDDAEGEPIPGNKSAIESCFLVELD